uniref:IP18729p n=2 Tax=Drosophila melanogaster TaxID=7227 RepID=C3KGP0_DROME
MRDHLMLIEIYDYAAKLLNNMTARGVRNSVGKSAESRTKESTGKLGSLLGRTLAKVAKVARSNPAQHVTNLPVSALLLQALDVADVARGQGIDYPITSTTGTTFNIITTTTTTTTTTTGSDPTDVLGSQPPAFSFPANVTGAPGSAGNANAYLPAGNLSGFIESSTTAVMSTLPIPTSTMATLQAQTVATFIAATGSKNRPTTIVVYPTVSPESIVIPIVSCIFGFPILALLVICCLRRRAKLARERDRRRNYDMQDHAVSLITDRRELSVYVLNEA